MVLGSYLGGHPGRQEWGGQGEGGKEGGEATNTVFAAGVRSGWGP